MGKGRKGGERLQRLRATWEAGDHGGARRLAGALLADPTVDGDEREAALEIIARAVPDRGVALAGGLGVAVALAISFWLILH